MKKYFILFCFILLSVGAQAQAKNRSICERDGFACLADLFPDDVVYSKVRFKTVRLDLSNAHRNTNGNYVSVVLKNLTTGDTGWFCNRIQTLAKSVGQQIRDNSSSDEDITSIGKLVQGSNSLYEYTFSSEMEVYLIDGNVDKSMVWIKKTPEKPEGILSCPDNNHPHAIDLGMSSGKKWACCNVGASSPEDYGGYYSWGATAESDYYDWSTYKHCEGSERTCHNIGINISGTQYDVARIKWGDHWCMPSVKDMEELKAICSFTEKIFNGVKGLWLKSNITGYCIFLPYTGVKGLNGTIWVGSGSIVWSSNVDIQRAYQSKAYALGISSKGLLISNDSYRLGGFPVRAVYSLSR